MRRSGGSAAAWMLVLVLVAGCQRPAVAPAALSEEDKTAIRAVFETVVNSIRTSNWDAFGATFADNAVFQPANSPALHGPDAIKAWVTAGPKPTAAFDFSNVEVSGEGNLAYATSAINMAFEGVPPDNGKQLVVLRKDPTGAWKTVAVSFNSDTPMPGMPAPMTTTTQ